MVQSLEHHLERKRVTQQSGELGKQTHLHHFGAQACVEGQIMKESQSDVQQIFVFAWYQMSKLLHGIRLRLLQTHKCDRRVTLHAEKKN